MCHPILFNGMSQTNPRLLFSYLFRIESVVVRIIDRFKQQYKKCTLCRALPCSSMIALHIAQNVAATVKQTEQSDDNSVYKVSLCYHLPTHAKWLTSNSRNYMITLFNQSLRIQLLVTLNSFELLTQALTYIATNH